MRTAQSRLELSNRVGQPAELSSLLRDVVLMATGILALAAVAVIHLVQIVPTFKATPLLGGAFVMLIGAAVALAVGLVARSDSPTWVAVGVLSVGAIAGYVFTRVISTPLGNQDVGNRACTLGTAALFVETALVAMSRYAVAAKRALRLAPVSAHATTNGRARLSGQLKSA
jgi:hypothetical protein